MNGLLTPEWFIFAASGHVTEKEVIQEGRKNIPRQILIMGKEKGNSDFLGNQGGGGGSRERQEGEKEQSSFVASDV